MTIPSRVRFLVLPVATAAFATGVVGSAAAEAASGVQRVPTNCSTSRIDHDTFIGTCKSGGGQWRLRVDCDRAEPDSVSKWLPAGRTASEGCTWGKARGASIEVR